MFDMAPRTASVPIYEYTLTLTDGTVRTARAMSYVLDGPWLVLDDPDGTVLTLRHVLVNEIARSAQQVDAREVDAL